MLRLRYVRSAARGSRTTSGRDAANSASSSCLRVSLDEPPKNQLRPALPWSSSNRRIVYQWTAYNTDACELHVHVAGPGSSEMDQELGYDDCYENLG